MLYQRVMGDFYPINSEGKFTLSRHMAVLADAAVLCYTVNTEQKQDVLKRGHVYPA